MPPEFSAFDHATREVTAGDAFHAQLDPPVGKQNPIAGPHDTREWTERRGNHLRVGTNGTRGQGHPGIGAQLEGLVSYEWPGAYLGPLKVLEHRHRFGESACQPAEVTQPARMFGVRAVREIQARHVHTGGEEFRETSGRVGGRP
jgi:hypothetical protein